MRVLVLAITAAAVLVPATPAPSAAIGTTEVVVALEAPSLARATRESRVLSDSVRLSRLDLDSPMSRAYLRELAMRQDGTAARIERAIPGARVRWRYSVVLDGLAVVIPSRALSELARIPGIRRVYPASGYRTSLDRSPKLIGADALWGAPGFATAGNGMKIGIIDDGIDQTHPFFSPAGYTYPPGFPKGQMRYTTPKVIVARAFAPPTTSWKYARLPFDPAESEHGTHVAGIAAGNFITAPVPGRGNLSGTAPRAYIGNYKALSTPSSFGLIDNAAEVVAAIEAAVRDGMDVINMSFGELETDPARNPVDDAVDGAAAAGVVPVAAAGNSYGEFGRGSVGSPATADGAIAAAAVTKGDVLADFSSSGPAPLSLRFKPEVSAPGVGILSSLPEREGMWGSFSGTSMASPHVAGAAALLRQRHPDWTVVQIESALLLTGAPVYLDSDLQREAPATSEGGGLVDLVKADDPLVFASPAALSFGLVRVGETAHMDVELADAGAGAGPWAVSSRLQVQANGARVTIPRSITVPGRLRVEVTAAADATQADVTGFVVLTRGGDSRRVPFWLRVERPQLGSPARVLPTQGRYEGNARNGQARVRSYRYPDDPGGAGISNDLPGPEQVFRVQVGKPVANVGVRLLSQRRGVRVTPRIVLAGDENRLQGATALPMDVNPYRDTYGEARPVAAVIRPAAGAYDVVFDTASRGAAGGFSFRLWIDDHQAPRMRLQSPVTSARGEIVLTAADAGSGVDPQSIRAAVDGRSMRASYSGGRVRIRLDGSLKPGRHRLAVIVADYQETKNSESVAGILPNTTVLRATFRVR